MCIAGVRVIEGIFLKQVNALGTRMVLVCEVGLLHLRSIVVVASLCTSPASLMYNAAQQPATKPIVWCASLPSAFEVLCTIWCAKYAKYCEYFQYFCFMQIFEVA